MNSPTIKVIVYEDNPDLRESLSVLLTNTIGFELLGIYVNCEDVINQVRTLRPNVVLMDIDMPVMNGLSGLKLIKSTHLDINVLMFTVFDDNERIFEAICEGAVGYMLKRTPAPKLLEAIYDANNGGGPMSPSIARKVLHMFKHPKVEPNNYKLTEREIEILTLLVHAQSYKMIASQKNIAIDTVRSHIKKIYEKLHVHSQAEAVAKALNEKIV